MSVTSFTIDGGVAIPPLPDPHTERAVTQFLFMEAELLDERRWSEWLKLVAEDIHYHMPVRRNVKFGEQHRENSDPESEISWFDEGYSTLAGRVRQLNTGIHWSEEPFSRIRHIVSNVQGKLRAGLNAFDLIRATFPAGTLSGAPKVRAMEIIEELEGSRRGPYGGAVGYFSFDGSMDTCITIRAALMQGNTVTIQAGAGLVADSEPASVYQETLNKARALAVTIRRAEQGLL